MNSWEENATEPLHVYTQFAQLIRSRLSFRHQKHVQYELVQEALEHQRDKLELLEAAERESRRLEDALERGGRVGSSSTSASASASPQRSPETEVPPSHAAPAARRAGQAFGLLSAVKHSLSGMMDVDPEATRRANIGKTRDNISQVSWAQDVVSNSQLEDSLQASAQDLKYASTTLQADLDRFQRQKVADVRQLAIELATLHRDWCRQNLEAWKAAQAAVREMPDHPNKANKSVYDMPQPPASQGLPDLAASMDRDLPPVPESTSSSTPTPKNLVMGGSNLSSTSAPASEPSDPLGSYMPTSPFKSEPADPLDVESQMGKVSLNSPPSTSALSSPTKRSAPALAPAKSPTPPMPASPPTASATSRSPSRATSPGTQTSDTGNKSDTDNEADSSVGPLGPL
jgi:sorting nexin-4